MIVSVDQVPGVLQERKDVKVMLALQDQEVILETVDQEEKLVKYTNVL